MTRGRVLRIEAELHDGQQMQIFNVHQATSGDVQLQQPWQILAKSVVECTHQRILLGGANANGTRVGYAESNTEHMTKVDALLENFVHDTQGELMSPSTVSWRRDNKSAKLDHIITWNLPHDGNAGSLGACWRSVGSGIPEGCKELDHPELVRRLANTPILKQHELPRFLPPGLTARSVVKAGGQVFGGHCYGHNLEGIVTVIIFFESALDFFKFLFNGRDLINVNSAKSASIYQWRAFEKWGT